ncbi:MAG: hypothetical protein KC649_02025 [Candidatus Omnitrophica bacterium]|nr:hypothetical protein [Candidatus Omnitrophota bacterium]
MSEEKSGLQQALTKKSQPTNCAETKARINRKSWYYKNGKYFASKAAAKDHFVKLEEEKKAAEAKAAEEAAAAKEAAAAEPAAEAAEEEKPQE